MTTIRPTWQKLDLAKVDWHATLTRLGVDPSMLENPRRLGPCPIENAGKTRFRFVNKNGRGNWFCNACGSGDGVKLVALIHSKTDAEAIHMIRNLDNGVGIKGPPLRLTAIEDKPRDVSRIRKMLQQVWNETRPIAGSPVAKYIERRVPGFDLSWLSSSLAYHPDLYHVDEATKKKCVLPAMVARVTGIDGTPVTLHRTYLSGDGNKAAVSPGQVKKQMTGVATLNGESIRLNVPHIKTRVAIVCEGIETGLALVAATKNRHAVFSALNAGNLAKFILSRDEFDLCIICADKDLINLKHGWRPGEHFANLLSQKLIGEGFAVKFRVPHVEQTDFADLWMERCKSLKLVA